MSAALESTIELPDLSHALDVGDLSLWERFIELICLKHNIACTEVQSPQQTGTWPVFTLGKEYAVKLFPKWGSDQHHGEEGQVVWDREVKSYAVLCDAPRDIGTLIPWEVAHGCLIDERPKGGEKYLLYIVTTFVRGTPIKDVAATKELSRDEEITLARDLGFLLGRLHRLKPQEKHTEEATSEWRSFIAKRRQSCYSDLKNKWKSMPPHFLAQLDKYLPENLHNFLEVDCVRFIHCDVIRDHVLLSKNQDGEWRISGLIDFGDARFGDPFYELAALHTNLFLCDCEALASLVLGYAAGTDITYTNKPWVGLLRPDFVYRAMVYLLLYEFNQFQNLKKQRGIFVRYPHFKDLPTLEDLAKHIWDISKWISDFQDSR